MGSTVYCPECGRDVAEVEASHITEVRGQVKISCPTCIASPTYACQKCRTFFFYIKHKP